MDAGGVGRDCGFVTTGWHPILEDVERMTPLASFSRSTTLAGNAGLIGQDTARVLRDHGYADTEIQALAETGVVLLG